MKSVALLPPTEPGSFVILGDWVLCDAVFYRWVMPTIVFGTYTYREPEIVREQASMGTRPSSFNLVAADTDAGS